MQENKQEIHTAYEWQLIQVAITGGNYLDVELDPVDFEDERCREIWVYLRKHKTIDIVEIEQLFDADKFVSNLLNGMVFVHGNRSIKIIAKKVKEFAHRRKVRKCLSMAVNMIDNDNAINDVALFANSAFDDVKADKEAVHVSEHLKEAYRNLQDAHDGKAANFTKTGLTDFDMQIGGLQNDGLIIIAGRPSMGKTAFMMKLGRNIAKEAPVLVFSLEMSGKQLAMRLLAAENMVDLQTMMMGNLQTEDWRKLQAATEKLSKSQLFINDAVSRSVGDIVSEVRRFIRAQGDIGAVLVDYLGLMDLPSGDRHDLKIAAVTRALKNLAGEIKRPVCLLSQLNRKVDDRALTDRKPRMSDLKDSGSIEADADQIIFMYREEVYNKTPENEGAATIIVSKNKNGRTGDIDAAWVAKSATYQDLKREF